MLAVAGIFYALPPALKVGPDWLMLVIVVLLVTREPSCAATAVIFPRRSSDMQPWAR